MMSWGDCSRERFLVSINQMEWPTIPACSSCSCFIFIFLFYFFNKGNIGETTSSKMCV